MILLKELVSSLSFINLVNFMVYATLQFLFPSILVMLEVELNMNNKANLQKGKQQKTNKTNACWDDHYG